MAQTTYTNESYKLMRAKRGRMIGGVAAGLAQASGMDVTVVRLCFGATMLFGGIGIPAYILMWIVLPDESPKRGRVIERAPESTARLIRMGLVGLAVLTVLNKVGGFLTFAGPDNRGFGFDGAIGLVLVGIGISVLFSRHRPDRSGWTQTQPPAPRSPGRKPSPADDDPYASHPDEEPPTFAGPFSEVIGTVHEAMSDALREARTTLRESRPGAPSQDARPETDADYVEKFIENGYMDDDDFRTPEDFAGGEQPRQTRPRIATVNRHRDDEPGGGFALGLARIVGWFTLIWWTLGALAFTALWVFGAVKVSAPVVLGVASWIVFLGVVNTLLHARLARAIIPTLALLLIPIGIAAATTQSVGSIGEVTVRPKVVSATQSHQMTVGQLKLDYGNTRFTKESTEINARLGAGELLVTVPNNATVVVNVRARVGEYSILGKSADGASPNERITSKGCEGAPKLELNLEAGAGNVEVQRENGDSKATCAAA